MIVFLLLFSVSAWSQSSTAPSFLMTGGAILSTNFIERGLTQTEGDPNLQGEFWFNFGPQFRLGLWGSNVRYDDATTTHFWLKMNADVKVDFSGTSNMIIKYSNNKFFKSNNRDGNTVGLHFNFDSYRILYETDSNWEGTREGTTYFAIGKKNIVMGEYIWDNQVGYTMPKVSGVTAYFDIRSGLGKNFKNIFVEGTGTYANATGALKERAELALLLSAAVKY